MAASIPAVEVTDERDALGVGGPDGEVNPIDPVDAPQVRPQVIVGPQVGAFVEEVLVVAAQLRPEGVGIAPAPAAAQQSGFL